jgi:hypothetical protein
VVPSGVVAALVAAIHVVLAARRQTKTWMAGTSLAMTPFYASLRLDAFATAVQPIYGEARRRYGMTCSRSPERQGRSMTNEMMTIFAAKGSSAVA